MVNLTVIEKVQYSPDNVTVAVCIAKGQLEVSISARVISVEQGTWS